MTLEFESDGSGGLRLPEGTVVAVVDKPVVKIYTPWFLATLLSLTFIAGFVFMCMTISDAHSDRSARFVIETPVSEK